jgi:hypothetical protein
MPSVVFTDHTQSPEGRKKLKRARALKKRAALHEIKQAKKFHMKKYVARSAKASGVPYKVRDRGVLRHLARIIRGM